MERKKTIGPWRMCGLIIGPILGSGIIILPPLAQNLAGDWAVAAWLVTIIISMLFAWIFGRLSLLFPGDSGVAAAVDFAFGPRVKKLTSLYLIGAVLFGPVAVMMTIVHYLPIDLGAHEAFAAAILTLIAASLLLRDIGAIGAIALLVSSVTSCTLFGGAVVTILAHNWTLPATPFSPESFFYTLLLLFWSVVGWEVIGNYSGELRNPERNLPRAVLASAVIIALVSLAVAVAMQISAQGSPAGASLPITVIIASIFGKFSQEVMALLVLALCSCTFLLFVGGTARLTASLAEHHVLPFFLAYRTGNGAPLAAIALLTAAHLLLLTAVGFGFITVEGLVAIANAFFLCNALIGILAAFRLFNETLLRAVATFLAAVLLFILLRSSPQVLSVAGTMAIIVIFGKTARMSLVRDKVR